jgi:hypothetical protein
MNGSSFDERPAVTVDAAELAAYRKLIAELPVTLRPALNGQLAEWETLFPYERGKVRQFLRGVVALEPAALDSLMLPLRKLEARMGVDHWNFSQASDTMENASLLARSEFYGEWREQIRHIYTAIEAAADRPGQTAPASPRLVIAILPASLPFDSGTVWKRWPGRGVVMAIDGDATLIPELLLQGPSSIPALLNRQGGGDASDLWLIDAESRLQALSGDSHKASSLSWASLLPLRDHVLERVNTVPRSIEITDRTLATIRNENMDAWWPAALDGQPQLRRFLIDLYLSGNGALIFSSAFVQWAASEALRRARPRVIVTRFGLRARPKPFTGIAIFENQRRISALPDVDDPQGSAVDASVLARYVLLGMERYPEAAHTAFLAIAESAKSAYLVLPAALQSPTRPPATLTPEQIAVWLKQLFSTEVEG